MRSAACFQRQRSHATFIVFAAGCGDAYNNGVARKPRRRRSQTRAASPVRHRSCFDYQIKDTAAAMVDNGMKAWAGVDHPRRLLAPAPRLTALVPHAAFFPDGMVPVIDYVHSLGLFRRRSPRLGTHHVPRRMSAVQPLDTLRRTPTSLPAGASTTSRSTTAARTTRPRATRISAARSTRRGGRLCSSCAAARTRTGGLGLRAVDCAGGGARRAGSAGKFSSPRAGGRGARRFTSQARAAPARTAGPTAT